MPKHTNDGNCARCELIFNAYSGFHAGLKEWFKAVQKKNPESHISQGGRGKKDQEDYFKKGASKAHYGQSAHNANLALDIFKIASTGQAEWPKDWFDAVIGPAVDSNNNSTVKTFEINWYGKKGAPFYELPHCEVKNWKELVQNKIFNWVEPL